MSGQSFHGCTKYAHCQLGNVCLSRRDGVLVPNVSGAASLAELNQRQRHTITQPWRARVLPMSHFKQLTNVYYADGKTYAAGCWRQGGFARNGRRLAAGYILSVGHLPVQDRLSRHGMCKLSVERSLIRGCLRREPLNCRRLVNTDLFVNVQRLRADLAAAVATRCKASGCVANLPDAVPAPALRSVDLCPNASSCCPG